jgi:hypothetical protein
MIWIYYFLVGLDARARHPDSDASASARRGVDAELEAVGPTQVFDDAKAITPSRRRRTDTDCLAG